MEKHSTPTRAVVARYRQNYPVEMVEVGLGKTFWGASMGAVFVAQKKRPRDEHSH